MDANANENKRLSWKAADGVTLYVQQLKVEELGDVYAVNRAQLSATVASIDEPTLRFAQNIGSAKLESDVYRIMGLIELGQGDYDAAMRSTLHCLWISRACGLKLRMMSSLESLGHLFWKRDDVENARGVFATVVKLGQIYKYPAPMDFAERALAQIGRPMTGLLAQES